jgi:hypothetical protein
MLLHASTLYKTGAITAQEKGRIKVLREASPLSRPATEEWALRAAG